MEKTLAWGSDLHLDMADKATYDALIRDFKNQNADALVISGDTSEKVTCFDRLTEIQKALGIPLYYILGNHDFYGSTVQHIKNLAAKYPSINYLTSGMIVPLSQDTALVGHDGWADTKSGNFDITPIIYDFSEIQDFIGFGRHQWKTFMLNLGEQSALDSENTLLKVFEKYSSVIFVTHCPPFREACYYEGKITDDAWAPIFVNLSLGRMLMELMENYPEKNLHVYCGHTHSKIEYNPLPNLKVTVAHAAYGKPEAQRPIKIV